MVDSQWRLARCHLPASTPRCLARWMDGWKDGVRIERFGGTVLAGPAASGDPLAVLFAEHQLTLHPS